MTSTLSAIELIMLFSVMLILSAIPSVSVLTVASRTISHGFTHGLSTTAGIITGDILFILVAILGLSYLVEISGDYFLWFNYVAAVYLIWLGLSLWRTQTEKSPTLKSINSSLSGSYLAGLMITLADQKAILFYLVFFPAFVDMQTMTTSDIFSIILIATLAISCSKLCYAYISLKSSLLMQQNYLQWLNRIAGGILVCVGLYLGFNGI